MSWKQLLRRKSIDVLLAEMAGENQLKRVLGRSRLRRSEWGAIIGAGIFVMTGQVAAVDAGPAIVISYAVAALGCALAALCYAEFAAMAPHRRQRIHVRLRDAGRTIRLDHRLGLDARVRHVVRDGRGVMDALLE